MGAALRIGDYLLSHGLAALTAPDEIVRRGLAFLSHRADPVVTQRELHRGVLSRGSAEDANALAEQLVALGALRSIPPPPRSGPGQPSSPAYSINPHVREDA